MARNESGIILGHYRTPPSVVRLIASNLAWNAGVHLVDPFAGTGEALAELAGLAGVPVTIAGNELSPERYEQARSQLDQALLSPAEFLALDEETPGNPDNNGWGQHGYGLMLFNPPYDTDSYGSRLEVQFLTVPARLVRPGGVLVAIVPEKVATSWEWGYKLLESFDHVATRRFPRRDYERFKQVVVFAIRRGHSYTRSYSEARDLEEELKQLWTLRRDEFQLPVPAAARPTLISLHPEAGEALAALASESLLLKPAWQEAITPKGDLDFRPLMQPGPGHAAQLLAAGMIDGIRVGEWVLKGYSRKYLETTEVKRDTSRWAPTDYINVERIANVIVAFNARSGDVVTYDSEKTAHEYESFLNKNLDELMAEVQGRYQPLFDGDMEPYEDFFRTIHSPGRLPGCENVDGLLEAQKRTAAALVAGYRAGAKGQILVGDMGVGKTVLSNAVRVMMATGSMTAAVAGSGKSVVICPDHLVGKWKREIETALRHFGAVASICRTLSDIDRAMALPGMSFIVLGQQAAKDDAIWRPFHEAGAYLLDIDRRRANGKGGTSTGWLANRARYRPHRTIRVGTDVRIKSDGWRKVREEVEVRRLVEFHRCPGCGQTLAGELADMLAAHKSSSTWKFRVKCPGCEAPLWQETPFVKGGRVALARYLKAKYARRYFLIADEAHKFQGGDTNAGFAFQWLASGAQHILLMTGTISGGRASSLFHLMYRALPHMRDLYRHNEVERFVDNFGLRLTVTDRAPTYEASTFGYPRLVGQRRSREIPGTSPYIVSLLLSHTAFLYIEDVADFLPPYQEYRLPVPPQSGDPAWTRYQSDIMVRLKDAAGSEAARGFPSLLSQWQQAALGWLDMPEQDEVFVGQETEIAVPGVRGHAPVKDRMLLALVQQELAESRSILVYFSQVNRRDAMSRNASGLRAAGVSVAVLRKKDEYSQYPDGKQVKVRNEEREAFVAEAVRRGARALMCSPELVETGLDLVAFPTVVYFNYTTYNLYTLRQSMRRSWRLGQENAVRVVFMYWQGSMQQDALVHLSKGMTAAYLVDGRAIDGLAAMDGQGDFLASMVNRVYGLEEPGLPLFPLHSPSAQPRKRSRPARGTIEQAF